MTTALNHKPYPTHALYNAVRDAIWEVQRNLQAPDALIASSFLTAMSIACQADIEVMLPTGQIRPCQIYLATIADSGERKSATDSLVCAPIYEHDKRKKKAYIDALAIYDADLRFWDAVDGAIQRKIARAMNEGTDAEQFRDELLAHGKKKPCNVAAR